LSAAPVAFLLTRVPSTAVGGGGGGIVKSVEK